jgi:hypothetical protein
MRGRCFLNVRHTNSIEKARVMALYIGFRARERAEHERGFFNEHVDHGADYKRHLREIENHPALQHSKTVKVHTMILSLRQGDYDALVAAGGSLKQIARDVIRDLEDAKGMKLHWIGALHENTGHPHVHLHIMSVGRDSRGNNVRLRITKQDIQWMRERMERHLEKYVPTPQYNPQKTPTLSRRRSRTPSVTKHAQTAIHATTALLHERNAIKTNARRRRRRARARVEQARQTPSLDQPRS